MKSLHVFMFCPKGRLTGTLLDWSSIEAGNGTCYPKMRPPHRLEHKGLSQPCHCVYNVPTIIKGENAVGDVSSGGDLDEFVIVHELVHLLAPNHGKVFKLFMHAYLPDWEEREQFLHVYASPEKR